MLLLESEALTKWCPLSRVLLPVHQSGNRISTFHKERASTPGDKEHYAQQERDCLCIASRCMFWRETTRPVALNRHAAQLGLGVVAHQMPRDAHGNVVTRETVGYCGAAPLQARSDVI